MSFLEDENIITLRESLEDAISVIGTDEVMVVCPISECNRDSKGKRHLYYNITSGLFFCQKCEYSGFLKPGKGIAAKKRKKKKFSGKLPDYVDKIDGMGGDVEKRVLKYLMNRGITLTDIDTYNIHYCYGGRYQNRVIFPFIRKEKLVYFSARSVLNNPRKKMLNASGSIDVFNVERSSKYREVVVVEGIFDAIFTGEDAIAVLGKNISKHQIEIIKEYDIDDINIMFDGDDRTSLNSAWEVAHKIKKHFRNVKIIELSFADPGFLKLRNRKRIGAWKGIFKTHNYNYSDYLLYKIKKGEV